MDIEFDCDKCGQHIAIEEAGAGLTVQCPKCNENLIVPAPNNAVPSQNNPTLEPTKRASMWKWILPVAAVAVLVLAFTVWTRSLPHQQATAVQDLLTGQNSVSVELFVRMKGGDTLKLSSVTVEVGGADAVVSRLVSAIAHHKEKKYLSESFESTFARNLSFTKADHSAVTDAEGKAFVKGITPQSFVFAHDKRLVGDKEEEYLWVVPTSEARDGKLLLGSHNIGLPYLMSRVESDENLKTKLLSELISSATTYLRMVSDHPSSTTKTKDKGKVPFFFDELRNVAVFADKYRGAAVNEKPGNFAERLSKIESDATKLLETKADEALKEKHFDDAKEIAEAVVTSWPGGNELKQRILEEAGGEIASVGDSYDDYREAGIRTFARKPKWVTSCAFGQDGRSAIVGGKEGEVNVWDVSSRKLVRACEGAREEIVAVQLSPDGKYVWAGTSHNEMKTWNLETGDSAGNFKGPIRFTKQLAISPDGRLAFCHGDYDAAVEAWALTTGEPVAKYAAGSVGITVEARVAARVESLSLSRDGRLILCGSGNGNIWIWDTRTGKLLAEMKGHKGEVKAVCISPDGKRAVTTGEGGIVRAWDLASGKVISTKPKNEYATSIHAVAISPNGRFAFDSKLELWELETGRLVCKLGEQKGVIGSVAISPDGRLALSGSWDGTVKLWRLPREVWTADK